MPVQVDPNNVRLNLKSNNQEHLLSFHDKLTENEKSSLLSQINSLEFSRIAQIYKNATSNSSLTSSGTIEPLSNDSFASTIYESDQTQHEFANKIKDWEKLGLTLIRNNKVAVLLLAGGQGTRLGSSAPKGCYDIGLPSHKSLFQLQAERIKRLELLTQSIEELSDHPHPVTIPWYVMTSGPTKAETINFFERHNFFGLKKDQIIFFEQGVLPCLTNDGKIMLEDKSKVAKAPDGNGGVYRALAKEGVLDDMRKRGIIHVHMYCVDNCLVRVADPVFIGYCASKEAECGSQVVRKTNPAEPVGILCKRNGKFQVVEYSEIDKETTEKRDSKGQLLFRAANIANHYYRTNFLEKIAKEIEPKMEYHIARKKIPTVCLIQYLTTGELIKPTTPNGMKLELFVFDVFPFTEKLAVLEVAREDYFSPLKNAPGTNEDSPETSRRDIMNQHRRFLEAAGAHVRPDANGECTVEISSLVSYAGENLHRLSGLYLQCPIIINNEEDLEILIKNSKGK
ncbi:nucleotide-diphospho-sugar transferase [Rozella allomycis CSF55]|uniref:UDP-N-acetylglucosamine diphosphorylase n=1 Tax=Rozella allomycis (strain CSF55) TaxID=988480 RepID=A0A075AXX4_ROZAC|nr:UTP--glucose-1-phosphate uridylyltransferase domain-containing protein [Rozella allomycis CSF55]RKP18700.1 nucleotide-diphospho-sugar transferase [Rozella allomycis CSF55]|eukprot:EPZ35145.1 UTP--glucose-1-phosphate uridylyltransferase domain-containing protein [Rozella allomycis CSF55]